MAVKELNVFRACITCKGKVEMDDECNDIGKCLKCLTMQTLSKCQKHEMAKVLVEGPNTHIVTLVAYKELLRATIEPEEEISYRSLLKSKVFHVTYNNYNVVTSVSRWWFNTSLLHETKTSGSLSCTPLLSIWTQDQCSHNCKWVIDIPTQSVCIVPSK